MYWYYPQRIVTHSTPGRTAAQPEKNRIASYTRFSGRRFGGRIGRSLFWTMEFQLLRLHTRQNGVRGKSSSRNDARRATAVASYRDPGSYCNSVFPQISAEVNTRRIGGAGPVKSDDGWFTAFSAIVNARRIEGAPPKKMAAAPARPAARPFFPHYK